MVTQERLKELFRYDPETGILTRRITRNYNAKAGDIVGCADKKGYLLAGVDGKTSKVHRIIWMLTYGYWPNIIDHIDGDKTNNAISNLRDVTNALNLKNSKRQTNNKSGLSGVFWNERKNKWLAYIGSKKTRIYLGTYSTIFEAAAVRISAQNKMGYTQKHGRN